MYTPLRCGFLLFQCVVLCFVLLRYVAFAYFSILRSIALSPAALFARGSALVCTALLCFASFCSPFVLLRER